jgi:hypothetical protein
MATEHEPPIRFRLRESRITVVCPHASLDESRVLDSKAFDRFRTWSDAYRKLLGKTNNSEELLALGREIYQWLDGAEGWLGRSLPSVYPPPAIVEFAAPLRPSDDQRAFLEVPWELLADQGGHLAWNEDLIYCPLRRLGVPDEPAPSSPYRLSVVFMAAAPRQERNLRYEEEETAILRATGDVGMDLTVEESGTLPLLAQTMARVGGETDVLHISCHGVATPEPTLALEDELGNRSPTTADHLGRTLNPFLPRVLFQTGC